MTHPARFCRSCGAALTPSSRFCKACGREMTTSDGREPTPAPQVSGPAAQEAGRPAPEEAEPAKSGAKGFLKRVFLLAVGVLLLTYGAKGAVLAVAGETTTGVVTEFRRDYSPPMFSFMPKRNNDYAVNFSYQVAGKTLKGATTLYDLHDTTKFFQNSTRIRYLGV